MTEWTGSFREVPDEMKQKVVAEVHVLFTEVSPGRSEVRINLPADAMPGMPGAAAAQARFIETVASEISTAIKYLAEA